MKELFVLGAGASHASAGTPLGADLVWEYHRDCSLMTPEINGKPDNSSENKEFANYIKFLEAVEEYYPELKGEKERFLARGYYMHGSPYPPKKEYFVDELLKRVQEVDDKARTKLIRQLIFEHLTGISIYAPSENNLYKILIDKILKPKAPGEVSIISLNFDLLLSEDFKSEVYFDYLINFDWTYERRKDTYLRRNPIPLMKLNGSLDWGICTSCGNLHLYSLHLGRFAYQDMSCSSCKAPVEPFIVIPHEQHGEKIQAVWEASRRYISTAEKITVIGYSFPYYDTKIIDLFRNSIHAGVHLEVVDVCPDRVSQSRYIQTIKKKYNGMFPDLKKDIKVNVLGFDGYLKDRLGADFTF